MLSTESTSKRLLIQRYEGVVVLMESCFSRSVLFLSSLLDGVTSPDGMKDSIG